MLAVFDDVAQYSESAFSYMKYLTKLSPPEIVCETYIDGQFGQQRLLKLSTNDV